MCRWLVFECIEDIVGSGMSQEPKNFSNEWSERKRHRTGSSRAVEPAARRNDDEVGVHSASR